MAEQTPDKSILLEILAGTQANSIAIALLADMVGEIIPNVRPRLADNLAATAEKMHNVTPQQREAMTRLTDLMRKL